MSYKEYDQYFTKAEKQLFARTEFAESEKEHLSARLRTFEAFLDLRGTANRLHHYFTNKDFHIRASVWKVRLAQYVLEFKDEGVSQEAMIVYLARRWGMSEEAVAELYNRGKAYNYSSKLLEMKLNAEERHFLGLEGPSVEIAMDESKGWKGRDKSKII